MAILAKTRRFTADEYHRMGEAGILGEDDRVELIDGEIVEMPPIGDRHNASVLQLNNLFARRLGERVIVGVQGPLRVGPYDEPQPDVLLLRRRPDFYRSGLPTPADVFLGVEVSLTTLAYDSQVKAPLYGRAGIPELWIVDLEHHAVGVFREPTPDGFRVGWSAFPGETISPLAFPDMVIPVADLVT